MKPRNKTAVNEHTNASLQSHAQNNKYDTGYDAWQQTKKIERLFAEQYPNLFEQGYYVKLWQPYFTDDFNETVKMKDTVCVFYQKYGEPVQYCFVKTGEENA